MSGGAIIAAMVRRKLWTPKDLFRHSEKGAYYDFGVMSSLWQDAGRTTQVTANGQNITAFDDLSGNGNHQILISGQTAWALDTATGGFSTLSTNGVTAGNGGYQTAGGSGITGKEITAVFGIIDNTNGQESWLLSQETNVDADDFMVGIDFNFTNAVQVSANAFDPGNATGRSQNIAASTPPVTESILAYLNLAATSYATGMLLRKNKSSSGSTNGGTWANPTASGFDGTKKLTFGAVRTNAVAGNVYRSFNTGNIRRAIVVNRALNATEQDLAETWVLS